MKICERICEEIVYKRMKMWYNTITAKNRNGEERSLSDEFSNNHQP